MKKETILGSILTATLVLIGNEVANYAKVLYLKHKVKRAIGEAAEELLK